MRALKRAYHRMALNMHPDKLGPFNSTEDLKKAESRFIRLAQVFEVLSDPTRRGRYDLHGHETRNANDPYGGSAGGSNLGRQYGVSEPFSKHIRFAGGAFEFHYTPPKTRKLPPITRMVRVTLQELYTGVNRSIAIRGT